MNAVINPIPLICAHRVGTRVIIHSHNTSSNTQHKIIGEFIHKINRYLFIKDRDIRIACSKLAGTWMFSGNEYVIVPNAIDLNAFQFSLLHRKTIREEYLIGLEDIVIGSVARFVNAKNHKFMIDIFVEFNKTTPNSKLMLVGDGPLLQEVRNYANSKEILHHVIFVGIQSNPIPFYSAFDLFLMPSLFEGLGFTAIEAQASGLPVVLSENIPDEVNPVRQVRFVNLAESPSKWCLAITEELYKAHSRKTNRVDIGNRLYTTMYNIDNLTRIMIEIYNHR